MSTELTSFVAEVAILSILGPRPPTPVPGVDSPGYFLLGYRSLLDRRKRETKLSLEAVPAGLP